MRTLSLIVVACVAVSSGAHAQPRRKAPPATQADIERLEKQIEAQQQLLDKMVALHRQYLQQLVALAEGRAAPLPLPPPPPADEPASEPKAEPKAEPPPRKAEPREAKKPEPRERAKPEGAGTVVGKVTGASDAVIYIEDISSTAHGTAEMKQEGKQFLPKVLVVQKGTKVAFPNLDAIFHNVFSVSPGHSFDLGSYRQGESKSVTMARPGVVTVYCNMHPQMVGHILVVPNGNYVRAGKDGFFRLPNVPAGNHRVVAWAPNAKPAKVEAVVGADQVVTIEVSLTKSGSTMHTKKDGLPYGSYDK
jgi:plastocyanin